MATSGTYTFSPTLASVFDEAFERCGIDPATITMQHVTAATRSLNLLLRSELSTDQINLWKVETYTPSTPAQAASTVTLPAGVIDVLEAVTRDVNDNDTPMLAIGRADWLMIPDKDQQGRPDRYWVDRTTGQKTLNFWPAQGSTAYDLVLNVLYTIEDAGNLDDTVDAPDLWLDTICAGLAKRLALKFMPDRVPLLEAQFFDAHRKAKGSDRERSSLILRPSFGRRYRRW